MSDDTTYPKLPISGKLGKAIISKFCAQPYKGNDKPEICGLGVSEEGVIATNGTSFVIIGEPQESYNWTERKADELEASRADIYGVPMAYDQLEGRVNIATGERMTTERASTLIDQHFDKMHELCEIHPLTLARIAAVALAADVSSVTLFRPSDKNPKVLGFEFGYVPPDDFVDLFHQYDEVVPVKGIFVVNTRKVAEEAEEKEL